MQWQTLLLVWQRQRVERKSKRSNKVALCLDIGSSKRLPILLNNKDWQGTYALRHVYIKI
jgi:hypothetical protein